MEMVDISICTHELVRNERGEIISNNNQVLIREKNSDKYMYVDITGEIAEIFGFHVMEEIEREQTYNGGNVECTTSAGPVQNQNNYGNKWTKHATSLLIDLCCEKYKTQFQSTTMKNEKVYDLVSNELAEMGHKYTSTQCRDKFKYLKMRYMKTKDNLKRSGAAPIMFDYYEEMNKYLGEKPNVEPVAIASSSRGPDDNSIDLTNTDASNETPAKKRKRESKENAVERRHQEKLEVQRAAINSFEKMMERLIEKL